MFWLFLAPFLRGFILAIIFITVINLFEYIDKRFFSCDSKCSEKDKENIKTLTRQTARWANASIQDKSPLVSLLHANYSTGYLWALQDVYKSKDIEEVTGEDFNKLKERITKVQDDATKKVISTCPNFNKYLDPQLAKLGGENI